MSTPFDALTGETFGVYRKLASGNWQPISRRYQREYEAERYRETLPKDWVVEVRAIAPMEPEAA